MSAACSCPIARCVPHSQFTDGGLTTPSPPYPREDNLLVIVLAHFTSASFELRLSLIKLGLLLKGQNGKCLLMHSESFTHQFSFKTRHFRQFLSGQCFVERSALTCLAQLLAFCPKLIAKWLITLRIALAVLFHFCFLVIS